MANWFVALPVPTAAWFEALPEAPDDVRLFHPHDLHATVLHLLGFDHEKLTYRFQGRDFRLTDVHGHVVKGILS